MMSDHLCSMNETLSKQREEIDTLKMSSKVCGAARGEPWAGSAALSTLTSVSLPCTPGVGGQAIGRAYESFPLRSFVQFKSEARFLSRVISQQVLTWEAFKAVFAALLGLWAFLLLLCESEGFSQWIWVLLFVHMSLNGATEE